MGMGMGMGMQVRRFSGSDERAVGRVYVGCWTLDVESWINYCLNVLRAEGAAKCNGPFITYKLPQYRKIANFILTL